MSTRPSVTLMICVVVDPLIFRSKIDLCMTLLHPSEPQDTLSLKCACSEDVFPRDASHLHFKVFLLLCEMCAFLVMYVARSSPSWLYLLFLYNKVTPRASGLLSAI